MKVLQIILMVFFSLQVYANEVPRVPSGHASEASSGKKVALVIGNDTYQYVRPLEKAANDARAMGKALEQAQFTTRVMVNASRTQMNAAINRFAAEVAGGGIGVFFFAGHGVQVNNQNFLIPVDLQDIQSEADIADQGVSLQGMQDKLAEAHAKFTLLVIDACRNNPLPRKAGRALGGTRGLTTASSAEGQMVVFSAGANQEALDKLSNSDANPNGVFTREFLPWLTKPGVTIRDAVLGVRSAVRARAKSVNHEQFPAIYDQAEGNFYFVEGGTQTVQTRSREQIEDDTWKTAEGINSIDAYETYLSSYPNGRYTAQAKMKLSALKKASSEAAAKPLQAPAPPIADNPMTAGKVIKDCPDCPEMVVIPAGSFEMGSNDYDSEKPVHRVNIGKAFALGKTEVTVGHYMECVKAGGCAKPE